MDFDVIASGIIKNTEMYNIYYNLYLQSIYSSLLDTDYDAFKSIPLTESLPNLIISIIVDLYSQDEIKTKDVLTLINYVKENAIENPSDDNIVNLMNMATEISMLQDEPSLKNIATTLDGFKNLLKKIPKKDRNEKEKSAIKETEKMVRQFKIMNFFHPIKESDFEIQQRKKKNIKDFVIRYNTGRDIRFKTNPQGSEIREIIKDEHIANQVEAILENPNYAKKAYSLLLDIIDSSAFFGQQEYDEATKDAKKRAQLYLGLALNGANNKTFATL